MTLLHCTGTDEAGNPDASQCKDNQLDQQISDDEALPEAYDSEESTVQVITQELHIDLWICAVGFFQAEQ